MLLLFVAISKVVVAQPTVVAIDDLVAATVVVGVCSCNNGGGSEFCISCYLCSCCFNTQVRRQAQTYTLEWMVVSDDAQVCITVTYYTWSHSMLIPV